MTTKIKKFLKSESGFTLIELLVVIGIIAILATIGAVNFSGARAKARDGKIAADLSQIRSVIEAAAAGTADGLYPTTLPPEIAGGNAPVPPRPTAQNYCYYVNTVRTVYYVSSNALEDTSANGVGSSGFNTATSTSTATWNAVLPISGITCTAVPATAGNVPNCDAATTLCYTGTTAA